MSNVTRDMIKNQKIDFLKNFKFCNFLHFFLANFFMLVTISLVIFNLQKCAIPQIKAKDILFWPYFLRFLPTINNFSDRKQRSCLILFNLNFINAKNCKVWRIYLFWKFVMQKMHICFILRISIMYIIDHTVVTSTH